MRWLLVILLAGILSQTCCGYALWGDAPSKLRLHLNTPAPSRYAIRVVLGTQYTPDQNGKVIVDMPGIRECDKVPLGIMALRRTHDYRGIRIESGGKVVRRVSLAKLRALPLDEESYHVLTLK
jgi:hypothetical protein